MRAYECDSLGHVNNAVYLGYLEQTTLDAYHGASDDPPALEPRTLAIEYKTPARYGDELEIVTWQSGQADGAPQLGYEIRRVADAAPVVHAQIEWMGLGNLELHAGSERPLPLKPFTPARDNGARPWLWRHAVHRYEIDRTQGASLMAYFNWLEEATFRTAHLSAWSMERLRAENFITLQYRHDAEFFAPAHNGDPIEITSRLFDVRRVRATWIHEIHRTPDRTLLLRDYSTGAFMDWQGNLRAAPPGMMERLVQGEA